MSKFDRSRSCRSLGDGGFTLLELLIVLAIVGILIAVIPSAVAGLPAMRLRSAADALGETLRQAHDDAVGTGRAVDVVVSKVRRSYAVQGAAPVDLPRLIDTLEAVRDGPAPLGEEVDYRFFADGSATGGEITLRHAQRRAVVTVEWLTGRVRVDD